MLKVKVNMELIQCACGCGQLRTKYDKRGREKRYIYKHSVLKGKHHSKETINKMKRNCFKWTQIREHPPNWKGGKSVYRRMTLDYGMNLNECQICKENKKRLCIHHINGNREDNSRKNLCVLCFTCHNYIHNKPIEILGMNTRFQKGCVPHNKKIDIKV